MSLSILDTRSAAAGLLRTAAVDAALVGAVCLLPWLHVYAPWAVALNPMLFLLLAGMLLNCQPGHRVLGRVNAFFLAILLPAFSALVVGMPTPMKAICMAAEFSTLVAVYSFASTKAQTSTRLFLTMLLAMLAGKVVYYALKAILIAPAVLVGTDVWMQAGSMLLWSGLFVLIAKQTR